MKKQYLLPVKMAMMALLLAATAGLVGCELDDESYDHNPPAGLGTMYIDNNTYTRQTAGRHRQEPAGRPQRSTHNVQRSSFVRGAGGSCGR